MNLFDRSSEQRAAKNLVTILKKNKAKQTHLDHSTRYGKVCTHYSVALIRRYHEVIHAEKCSIYIKGFVGFKKGGSVSLFSSVSDERLF